MKYRLNSVAFQIRLLMLTLLLAVTGFAFVSQLSDSAPHGNDTPSVLVVEMQEFLNDAEPVLDSDSSSFLGASFLLAYVAQVFVSALNPSKVTPHLTFIYHTQPRSPPSNQLV